jgi:hypothetical protein
LLHLLINVFTFTEAAIRTRCLYHHRRSCSIIPPCL